MERRRKLPFRLSHIAPSGSRSAGAVNASAPHNSAMVTLTVQMPLTNFLCSAKVRSHFEIKYSGCCSLFHIAAIKSDML